jgi:hypothetical protein
VQNVAYREQEEESRDQNRMATANNHGSNNHLRAIFGKSGVPSPVTGSHPGTAVYPFVPQPGLLPDVISWNASWK